MKRVGNAVLVCIAGVALAALVLLMWVEIIAVTAWYELRGQKA